MEYCTQPAPRDGASHPDNEGLGGDAMLCPGHHHCFHKVNHHLCLIVRIGEQMLGLVCCMSARNWTCGW